MNEKRVKKVYVLCVWKVFRIETANGCVFVSFFPYILYCSCARCIHSLLSFLLKRIFLWKTHFFSSFTKKELCKWNMQRAYCDFLLPLQNYNCMLNVDWIHKSTHGKKYLHFSFFVRKMDLSIKFIFFLVNICVVSLIGVGKSVHSKCSMWALFSPFLLIPLFQNEFSCVLCTPTEIELNMRRKKETHIKYLAKSQFDMCRCHCRCCQTEEIQLGPAYNRIAKA